MAEESGRCCEESHALLEGLCGEREEGSAINSKGQVAAVQDLKAQDKMSLRLSIHANQGRVKCVDS